MKKSSEKFGSSKFEKQKKLPNKPLTKKAKEKFNRIDNNKDIKNEDKYKSIEEIRKDINTKVSEMERSLFDAKKIARIKKLLPTTPVNQHYVLEQVNKLYYGDFHRYLQNIKRGEQNIEVEPKYRLSYEIAFPGVGYDGVAYIILERSKEDLTTWTTNEFGYGYTTGSFKEPDFLNLKISKTLRTKVKEFLGFPWFTTYSIGTVMGIPCKITRIQRSHENSDYCYRFRFKFNSKKEADKFSEKLSKIKFDPKELLPFMWKSGINFAFWNLTKIKNNLTKIISDKKLDYTWLWENNKALNEKLHKKFPPSPSCYLSSYYPNDEEEEKWEKEYKKYRQSIKLEDIVKIVNEL